MVQQLPPKLLDEIQVMVEVSQNFEHLLMGGVIRPGRRGISEHGKNENCGMFLS